MRSKWQFAQIATQRQGVVQLAAVGDQAQLAQRHALPLQRRGDRAVGRGVRTAHDDLDGDTFRDRPEAAARRQG